MKSHCQLARNRYKSGSIKRQYIRREGQNDGVIKQEEPKLLTDS